MQGPEWCAQVLAAVAASVAGFRLEAGRRPTVAQEARAAVHMLKAFRQGRLGRCTLDS
jgi:hypothetical protein